MHKHRNTEIHKHNHCLKSKIFMVFILVHNGLDYAAFRITKLCPPYLNQKVIDA